jgi:hypothetical protein
MSTSEERLKILQMLKDKKISVNEASKLLDVIEPNQTAETEGKPNAVKGKWMRITVTDAGSGKAKVNLKLPISVVKAGIKIGAKFSPELGELDSEKLMEAIQDGGTGKILDVNDAEDDEHIEIYID